MDQEREEVFERIPWERLERRGGDGQWLVYALAGAVVLGGLAYSFMRNQPTSLPPAAVAVTTTVPATSTTSSNMGSTPSTVPSPVVVAEADLFAIDPERLLDEAVSHAEWFAVEYISVDGSEQSREVLGSLLPEGVPLPVAPEGTQVFVDWARARATTQTGPVSFEIEVLVRSLASSDDSGFTRQTPLSLTVGVEFDDDGAPRVTTVPSLAEVTPGPASKLVLSEVPEELIGQMGLGESEVLGGVQRSDGGWDVVVIVAGPDGVKRPVTLRP